VKSFLSSGIPCHMGCWIILMFWRTCPVICTHTHTHTHTTHTHTHTHHTHTYISRWMKQVSLKRLYTSSRLHDVISYRTASFTWAFVSSVTLLCSWHTLILLLLWFSFVCFWHSCMLVISLILSCLVLASLKTRHGRNIISFYFFLFVTGRAESLSLEQCVQ